MKAYTDDVLRANLERDSVKIPEAGCWLWMRGLDKDGYGQAHRHNKNIRAHRLSWLLHRGDLKSGFVVMHNCDTPTCVNPYHLEQVTQIVNNDDKMAKGRHRVASGDEHYSRHSPRTGERCPQTRLNETTVKTIRERFAGGERQESLAKEFDVSRTCISAIVVRRIWKHI
jgi:hypothetical protein